MAVALAIGCHTRRQTACTRQESARRSCRQRSVLPGTLRYPVGTRGPYVILCGRCARSNNAWAYPRVSCLSRFRSAPNPSVGAVQRSDRRRERGANAVKLRRARASSGEGGVVGHRGHSASKLGVGPARDGRDGATCRPAAPSARDARRSLHAIAQATGFDLRSVTTLVLPRSCLRSASTRASRVALLLIVRSGCVRLVGRRSRSQLVSGREEHALQRALDGAVRAAVCDGETLEAARCSVVCIDTTAGQGGVGARLAGEGGRR
jgi:hypothetical protein